ncbi:hypothetical protein B0H11DRAFT_1708620, partial [Mycena galericulata]
TTGGSVNVVATGAAETGAAETGAPAAVDIAVTATAAAASSTSASSASSSANLQTFTQALGGQVAPPVTAGGSKGFVTDNSDFVNLAAALGRSCDVQHNLCANAANSGGGFTVSACDAQDTACHAVIPS